MSWNAEFHLCRRYLCHSLVEETIEDALDEITQYYRSNSLRAHPDNAQITAFHLRNKEAKRSLKVKWSNTELENAKEVLRCHSEPHTELETAYTQYKDEGGHTQQPSVETRSGAQVQARSEPQRLLYVISSLNMQHQSGPDLSRSRTGFRTQHCMQSNNQMSEAN